MTPLGKMFESLARTPEETRAEHIRSWRAGIERTTPISDAEARARWRVAGVIQNVRIDPREGRGYVEATIIDGSGAELIVRLTGRTNLAGWRLGEGLIVEGTVAENDGIRMILNPEWDLVTGPERG